MAGKSLYANGVKLTDIVPVHKLQAQMADKGVSLLLKHTVM